METQVTVTDAKGNQRTLRMPLLPAAIAIAELSLVPLLLLMFAFGHLIIRLMDDLGFDLPPAANIAFLHNQSASLAARGVDPSSIAIEFQIFGIMIWISIAIGLLRLASGPFLFDFMNARAVSLRKRYVPPSPGILALGCLIVGSLALWLFTRNAVATSAPFLGFLLNHSPRAYIWLDAFVLLFGLIFLTEALLLIFLLMSKHWTSRLFNPYE
jgi:hypothetical protein